MTSLFYKYYVTIWIKIIEYEIRLQVLQWIQNNDTMIMAGYMCPTGLQEAEKLKEADDKFQQVLEVGALTS